MIATLTTVLYLLLAVPWAVTASPAHIRRASHKTGLGWPNGPNAGISQYYSSDLSWYYSWSPWPVDGTDLEFVPMFWGAKQTVDFQAQCNPSTIAQRDIKHILGMNEPNEPSQGNINAGEGACQWKTFLEPFKASNPGIRLGSPAVTSSPSGKQWMYDFFGACGGGCSVDFITIHWYGLGNASDFIAHVTDFHNSFQKPIWVTEWACQNFGDPKYGQCSDDEIVKFMDETQKWMDKTDWVERYAWFGAMKDMQNVNPANALMDPSGQITQLGKQYVGLAKPSTSQSSGATSIFMPSTIFGPSTTMSLTTTSATRVSTAGDSTGSASSGDGGAVWIPGFPASAFSVGTGRTMDLVFVLGITLWMVAPINVF